MRTPDFPINPLFIHRWSSRAFSDQLITQDELMTLFEAARWAPSSYNIQPWRFIYAFRNTPAWQKLFDLMIEFNQSWANKASVLVVIVSRDNAEFNNTPAPTHSFDTGAAWQNLALQATVMNIVAHGMSGFDYAKAKKDLAIPDGYTVEAMCALGKPGHKEDLSPALQKQEQESDRKPVKDFIFEGVFSASH